MPEARFRLANFISEIKDRGLARPNKFEVLFPAIPGFAPLQAGAGGFFGNLIGGFAGGLLDNAFGDQALLSRLGVNGDVLGPVGGFIAGLLGGNPAPLNLTSLTSLFCEISGFPGMNIQTKPFKIQGPARPMPTNVEYGGEGITMTFHLDQNMLIKQLFDSWMHSVIQQGTFNINYRANYARPVYIIQLDDQFNWIYVMTLIQAFPRSMEMVYLNHSQKDVTSKLNVVFSYRYWETRGYMFGSATDRIVHSRWISTGTTIPPSFYGPAAAGLAGGTAPL